MQPLNLPAAQVISPPASRPTLIPSRPPAANIHESRYISFPAVRMSNHGNERVSTVLEGELPSGPNAMTADIAITVSQLGLPFLDAGILNGAPGRFSFNKLIKL